MINSNLVVPITRRVSSSVDQQRTKIIHLVPPAEDEMSIEERVTMLLLRDLVRFGWRLSPNSRSRNALELTPPTVYAKDVARQAMAFARQELLYTNKLWIEKHIELGRKNLASGEAVLSSSLIPRIEVCETEKSKNIFRLFRYYWSSPYSEYVGRRIRCLIRDDGIAGSPVIGIAALGSSIIHIPDRDKWIGWDVKTRTERIIYMMDAYVLGALPPYNHLLGGKLVAYLLASNEMRQIYQDKYAKSMTIIKNRQASDLALIVTTSLYGSKSSQYNRIRYDGVPLYLPIGETAGYGTLHISNETFDAFRQLLQLSDREISYEFGNGANWRLRVIKRACEAISLDSETILKHSFQRGLFAVPLADNWKSFMNGGDKVPEYKDLPMKHLVEYWKGRWLRMRKENDEIVQRVRQFTPEQFIIS